MMSSVNINHEHKRVTAVWLCREERPFSATTTFNKDDGIICKRSDLIHQDSEDTYQAVQTDKEQVSHTRAYILSGQDQHAQIT